MGKLAKFASYMYVLETREDETLQSRRILQMWGGGGGGQLVYMEPELQMDQKIAVDRHCLY